MSDQKQRESLRDVRMAINSKDKKLISERRKHKGAHRMVLMSMKTKRIGREGIWLIPT